MRQDEPPLALSLGTSVRSCRRLAHRQGPLSCCDAQRVLAGLPAFPAAWSAHRTVSGSWLDFANLRDQHRPLWRECRNDHCRRMPSQACPRSDHPSRWSIPRDWRASGLRQRRRRGSGGSASRAIRRDKAWSRRARRQARSGRGFRSRQASPLRSRRRCDRHFAAVPARCAGPRNCRGGRRADR